MNIELKSTNFLFLYIGVCFCLAFLFIMNSTSGAVQDHVGYPVVDDAECGSDEDRVLNVFSWAIKHGAYINPRVTTGMFPIPGETVVLAFATNTRVNPCSHSGDQSGAMVRGLRATGPLRKGQRIFIMPQNLLLNLRMVLSPYLTPY
jgi:hypothetical protein